MIVNTENFVYENKNSCGCDESCSDGFYNDVIREVAKKQNKVFGVYISLGHTLYVMYNDYTFRSCWFGVQGKCLIECYNKIVEDKTLWVAEGNRKEHLPTLEPVMESTPNHRLARIRNFRFYAFMSVIAVSMITMFIFLFLGEEQYQRETDFLFGILWLFNVGTLLLFSGKSAPYKYDWTDNDEY